MTSEGMKREVRSQLMICRQRLEELELGPVDEESFNAIVRREDQEEKFHYGTRALCRGALEAELNESVPFLTLHLLESSYSGLLFTTDNFSESSNGLFCTGKESSQIIRFAVKLECK